MEVYITSKTDRDGVWDLEKVAVWKSMVPQSHKIGFRKRPHQKVRAIASRSRAAARREGEEEILKKFPKLRDDLVGTTFTGRVSNPRAAPTKTFDGDVTVGTCDVYPAFIHSHEKDADGVRIIQTPRGSCMDIYEFLRLSSNKLVVLF